MLFFKIAAQHIGAEQPLDTIVPVHALSSSGGYYKYHCKNWQTGLQCNEWVYVNGSYCAACNAKGYY